MDSAANVNQQIRRFEANVNGDEQYPRLIHGERDRNEALYHLSHALVCGREDRRRSSGRSHGRRRVRGNGCEAKRRCLDLRSNDDAAALRGG